MSGKRKIIIAVVLLLALVLLCPLPVPVKLAMEGSKVSSGVVDETVDMSFSGWELNYLLKTDQLRGTLTIKPYGQNESGILSVKVVGPVLEESGIRSTSFDFYDAATNQMVIGGLSYSSVSMAYQDSLDDSVTYIAPISE